MVVYLEKEEIVFINQRTVAEHGGNFIPPHNFLHEENLDYLIEAVQAEMFGAPLYESFHWTVSAVNFQVCQFESCPQM